MRTSALAKATVIGLPTGLWLAFGAAGVVSSIAFLAGTTLIALAWVRLADRSARRAERVRAAAEQACDRRRIVSLTADARAPRIERRPTGRAARDFGCARPRATARARRSTRR